MAGLLPQTSNVRYGPHEFSASAETTEFRVVPQMDSARRTVTHVLYNVTLVDYLTGSPDGAEVQAALEILSKPALPLYYADTGYGDIKINVGKKKDLKWGPIPKVISLEHKGKETTKLTWSVEFATLDCKDAVYSFAPMEYVFRVSYDIGRTGYSVRTVTGHLVIPQTRNGPHDRKLKDSVDSYRAKINPAVPTNFRRIPGNFTISEDKCRLDFSITDEQFQGPPPIPGVVDWTLSHEASNNDGRAAVGIQWQNTLTATYELAPGVDPAGCIEHFIAMLYKRMDYARNHVGGKEGYATVIPTGYRLSEPSIHGPPRVALTASYLVIAGGLTQFLGGSGMFTPVPGSDWKKWNVSMQGVLGPRGTAGLVFEIGEDAIVDLCGPNATVAPAKPNFTQLVGTNKFPTPKFPAPTPDSSWLHYECSIRVENDTGTAELRSLPVDDFKPEFPASDGAQTGLPEGGKTIQLFGPAIPKESKNAPIALERRAGMAVDLILRGCACRLGFPVPRPFLSKVGNVVPVETSRRDRGEHFEQVISGSIDGHSIYIASWVLRYTLPELPAVPIESLVPKNPLFQ